MPKMPAQIQMLSKNEAIRRLMDFVRNKSAMFKSIHMKGIVELQKWVMQNFQTEGGKVGGWKPLSAMTIARRRHGTGTGLDTFGKRGDKAAKSASSNTKGAVKILQDKGRLKSDWKINYNEKEFVMQSQHYYSFFHDQQEEYGASGKGSKIPQRRILPNAKEFEPIMEAIVKNESTKALDALTKRA